MSIENIVRPFLLPQDAPAQRVETPGQVDAQIIKLQIGLGGSGKTMSGSFTYNETFYCVKYQSEKHH